MFTEGGAQPAPEIALAGKGVTGKHLYTPFPRSILVLCATDLMDSLQSRLLYLRRVTSSLVSMFANLTWWYTWNRKNMENLRADA
jgi:hypothetical protein